MLRLAIIVIRTLLNGDRNNQKTKIGTVVNKTTINLDEKAILCLVPQLSHSTGLYDKFALKILPHLNKVLQLSHLGK